MPLHAQNLLSFYLIIRYMLNQYYLTYAVPKLEREMYNQIANYVFLQREINIKISDDAPCIYM